MNNNIIEYNQAPNANGTIDVTTESVLALLDTGMPQTEKIIGLCNMSLDEYAKNSQHTELFAIVTNWLLSLDEVEDEQVQQYCNLGAFASAACENGNAFILF